MNDQHRPTAPTWTPDPFPDTADIEAHDAAHRETEPAMSPDSDTVTSSGDIGGPDPTKWVPPRGTAPCIEAVRQGVEFHGEADDVDYDAGHAAKRVCAGCPYREPCLTGSVARNEEFGIWGGAGAGLRRALRKSWLTSSWDHAVEAHFRRVDGVPALPGDDALLVIGGENMTHGSRAAFAKGCRCAPCSFAASVEGALASTAGGRSAAGGLSGWQGNVA